MDVHHTGSEQLVPTTFRDAASVTAKQPGAIARLRRVILTDELRYLDYSFHLTVILAGIGLARGLYVLTLQNTNLWLSLSGVLLTTVVASIGVSMIVLAYWDALTGTARLEPFLLGALFLVVAIAFSVEAFAGLTWLLWKHHALGVSAPADFSLWDAEHLFLWNVVDSVPLLDIPRAMAWQRPAVTSGFWVGAMLVAFRIAVLLPIIGLGALGLQVSHQSARKELEKFRDEEWNVIETDNREQLESRWDRPVLMIKRGASALAVVGVVIAIVATSFGVRFLTTIGVDADSSWPRQWLDTVAHSRYTLPLLHREVRPLWLLNVADVTVSIAIVAIVLLVIYLLALALLFALAVGSLTWRIAAVLVGCSLVVLVCEAFAAVAVALVNLGFAEPAMAIPVGREYATSLEWFGWNAARLAPLADVPSTTNWTLGNPFHDRWIGALTVLLRLLMVLIVLWPVGMLVAITVEEARRRAPPAEEVDSVVGTFHP